MTHISNASTLSTFPKAPVLSISDGSLEALKWVAVVCMVLDHVGKYLLHDTVPALFFAGRLTMPLFGFVLGYNLSRPGALASGVYFRTSKRLLVWALISCVPFMALNMDVQGLWPLNILFLLLLATSIAWLFDMGGRWPTIAAIQLFVFGGFVAEFFWFGLLACLTVWAYRRNPSWSLLLCWLLSLASFYVFNGNFWAFGVVPFVIVASLVRFNVPRMSLFFYTFYPAHLSLIWLISNFVKF